MKKLLAGIAVVAVLAAGGIAAVGLVSGSAVAQDDGTTGEQETTRVRPTLEDALGELVEENVITQEQADAVAAKLSETFAHRGDFGRAGASGLRVLRTFLDALDMTPPEVAEALENGSTIAELAENAGLDVESLMDEAVAAAEARIQTHVDAGRIDAETAAEKIAELEQRITDVVNGDADFGFRRTQEGRFGPRFGAGEVGNA